MFKMLQRNRMGGSMSGIIYSDEGNCYFLMNDLLFQLILDTKGLPVQVVEVEEMPLNEFDDVTLKLNKFYATIEIDKAMCNIEYYE